MCLADVRIVAVQETIRDLQLDIEFPKGEELQLQSL